MRILILSDSHGSARNLREVLLRHPDITTVLHLGDGNRELQNAEEAFPTHRFYAVAGNCDFACPAPGARLETFCGKKVFLTHGHMYGVKGGYYTLECAARERGVDIALFGHTHLPFEDYADGLYLFNPGSLKDGNYGILEISSAGIMTRHMKL